MQLGQLYSPINHHTIIASLGVTGYEVIVHSPWGWPLVVLVCLGVLALYFAYSGLLREQRDLEALSDVSLTVSRSGQRVWSRRRRRSSSAASGMDKVKGVIASLMMGFLSQQPRDWPQAQDRHPSW